MGFKTWLVKIVIKSTPNCAVSFVSNIILKGIAEISDFVFDLDARSVYMQITLAGEKEAIEFSVDGFGIISNEESHQLIIHQAHSNKPWLNNMLSRIVGKAWQIPDQPKYKTQIELIAELLKTGSE